MSDAIVTAVKHVRSITVATANGVSGSVTTTPTPIITITLGAITPSGVQVSGLTASQAIFTDGSKNLVSNAITGTGNVVMSASPTLTGTITCASIAASGNINVNGATNTAGFGVNLKNTQCTVSGEGYGYYAFNLGSASDLAAGNTEYLAIETAVTSVDIYMGKTGTGVYRPIRIRNNGATQMTFESAGGVTVATAITCSTTLATTGLHTASGGVTLSSSSLTMSGNISSAAWTTNGLRIKGVSATLTDTTSSGTVAAAYTDVIGGNTIAASSSTTFTDYCTMRIEDPIAGSNVTMTNKFALCAASARLGTTTGVQISDTGVATFNNRILQQDGADVASATSLTLGNGNYFRITGTTTISRIESSGWTDGSVIYLKIGGTLTMSHNAADSGTSYGLFLSGSANFAASANDTITFILDSAAGLWRQLTRAAA